jgi:hypothetical protein
MESAGVILGGILLAAVFILGIVWSKSRGASMLESWARTQGYELLSYGERWFFRGPFFWGTSEGQKVYKVTMRDLDGRVRTAYARCGGFWLGLWTDAVELRWDD